MDFITQDEAKVKIKEWLIAGETETTIRQKLADHGFIDMVINNLLSDVKSTVPKSNNLSKPLPTSSNNIIITPISNNSNNFPTQVSSPQNNSPSKLFLPMTWLVFIGGFQGLINIGQSLITSTTAISSFVVIYISLLSVTSIGLMIVSFGLRKFKPWALPTLIILYIFIAFNTFLEILATGLSDSPSGSIIIVTLVLSLVGVAVKLIFPIYFWKQYKKRGL